MEDRKVNMVKEEECKGEGNRDRIRNLMCIETCIILITEE